MNSDFTYRFGEFGTRFESVFGKLVQNPVANPVKLFRVTHHVVLKVVLTSKQQRWAKKWSLGCESFLPGLA